MSIVKFKTKRKRRKYSIDTGYLDKVYYVDEFKKVVRLAVKRIKKFEKQNAFEAIAFTGISGAAIAFPLSLQLNKPLICVRKPKDNSHFEDTIEGCINANSYIIVDDFIDTGKTIARIISEIKEHREYCAIKYRNPKLVGVYLYDDSWNKPKKTKFISDTDAQLDILKIPCI